MSNLTLSVDEQLIKRARLRAIEQGTSLSAKVREFLQDYVSGSQQVLARERAEATVHLLAAMDATAALAAPAVPSARGQRRSLRDEIYEGDFRARSRVAPESQAKAATAGKGAKARAARAG
jgi:plasmid stability protein